RLLGRALLHAVTVRSVLGAVSGAVALVRRVGAAGGDRIAEVLERPLELLLDALTRLEVSLAAARDEDGLVRLRVAGLRLRLRLLYLEDAEVAEFDADLRVGLDHEF